MARSFTVRIKVGSWGTLPLGEGEEIEVVIDTGATYTSLLKLLPRLGVPFLGRIGLRLANGEHIEREYGPCLVQVLDRWIGTTVLFENDSDIPLLGTNTMDDASVDIDLINKRLIPVQAI
jgi:predicted aspartyl protease